MASTKVRNTRCWVVLNDRGDILTIEFSEDAAKQYYYKYRKHAYEMKYGAAHSVRVAALLYESNVEYAIPKEKVLPVEDL